MTPWIFAGVNRLDRLRPELLSRLVTFDFKPYILDGFLEVTQEVITGQLGGGAWFVGTVRCLRAQGQPLGNVAGQVRVPEVAYRGASQCGRAAGKSWSRPCLKDPRLWGTGRR